MTTLLTCQFNMDSACVELRYSDGTVIAIDCTAVERSIDTTIRSRSELDWLVYNDPFAYVNLVLRGEIESYLKGIKSQYSGIGWNA